MKQHLDEDLQKFNIFGKNYADYFFNRLKSEE